MKAVNFKEANVKIAEEQSEYQTLPAHLDREQGIVTACFELNELEKKQVAEEGKIYLTVLTFNKPLQPISASVLNPFEESNNQ